MRISVCSSHFCSSDLRCGLKSSAAARVVVAAAFDRAPRDRAADRAEHGAERLRIARCDDVAEHPAGDAADDQSGRAVVAAAIIFAVAPAIAAVVVRQAALAVTAGVAVIIIGIITVLGGCRTVPRRSAQFVLNSP